MRDAIQKQVKKIAPGFGYASGACGSDILFLEAMLERGSEANVVLPFAKEQFIQDSVAFAGGDWLKRFESVLETCDDCDNRLQRANRGRQHVL